MYRFVIENINDTFYRADTNGKLVMVSLSATKLLGHDSADDMIGWDIAQSLYYHPATGKYFFGELKERDRLPTMSCSSNTATETP